MLSYDTLRVPGRPCLQYRAIKPRSGGSDGKYPPPEPLPSVLRHRSQGRNGGSRLEGYPPVTSLYFGHV